MLTYQKWIIEIWLSIVFGIQPAGGCGGGGGGGGVVCGWGEGEERKKDLRFFFAYCGLTATKSPSRIEPWVGGLGYLLVSSIEVSRVSITHFFY